MHAEHAGFGIPLRGDAVVFVLQVKQVESWLVTELDADVGSVDLDERLCFLGTVLAVAVAASVKRTITATARGRLWYAIEWRVCVEIFYLSLKTKNCFRATIPG